MKSHILCFLSLLGKHACRICSVCANCVCLYLLDLKYAIFVYGMFRKHFPFVFGS